MEPVGYMCAIIFGMLLGVFASKLSSDDDDNHDNHIGYA